MGQDKPPDQPPPPPPTFWERVGTRIRTLPGGGLLFAVVPLIVIGYFGWYYYGAEHFDRTLYSLQMENIDLTPQPEWICEDVRAEVYRSGSLANVALLDPQAAARIAHALMHIHGLSPRASCAIRDRAMCKWESFTASLLRWCFTNLSQRWDRSRAMQAAKAFVFRSTKMVSFCAAIA